MIWNGCESPVALLSQYKSPLYSYASGWFQVLFCFKILFGKSNNVIANLDVMGLIVDEMIWIFNNHGVKEKGLYEGGITK